MLDAVVLAIALAMDATAVAAARGTAGMRGRDAVWMAIAFGGFQGGMAAIGWGAGVGASRWIETWDHWLAFGLLSAIGAKMLYEAARGDVEEAAAEPVFGLRTLLLLAIATSIDALAAGVSLPVMGAPPWLSVALIGGVSFVLSLAGAHAGRVLGDRFGRKLEAAGGLALIAIGVKTLLDHVG